MILLYQVARLGTLAKCTELVSTVILRRAYSRDVKALSSVIESIGSTPVVRLDRLTRNANVSGTIYAKLEYLNPGFSKKDRIARQIIEDARKDGSLKPGQTVVELTSGNTGTGLAIVCGVLGHPFVAVMSKGNSLERARMMRALGAEVVLVDQAKGSISGQVSGADLQLVEEETKKIVAERGAFRADQFNHLGSFNAHFLHTGPEAWSQSGQTITAFVDFVGSAGTFAGVSAYLKQTTNNAVTCVLVEPDTAQILGTGSIQNGAHRIQGGGYSMSWESLSLLSERVTGFPPNRLVDEYMAITDEQAIAVARALAKEEGIFGGFSGGANVAGALQYLRTKGNHDEAVLVLICDSGLKYLSTDLWE